ncbi:peroxiredoxin [Xinfangfangia pollutisoli]|uniref:peroxiredoxin n=1 Tax=Xinfangfangia pollutisoli TaxID=2865960 RepID=UPI001CD71EED|nr:peroxiredoxin [Xinfangfangia pollutisoli]
MTKLTKGATLPDATLLRMGEAGPEGVSMAALTKGRKVVIFGLPGAYTGTCSTAHVPSFARNADKFRAKGVDEIVCVSVNDPFVMKAWGEATGATKAGITMLGDAGSEFTKAIGMEFDRPQAGLYGRSLRYALYAVDGVVQQLNIEENAGQCEISGGETLLGQI